MRIRNWSIRAKIILLVVPPLASLLALWIFATVVLLGPALDLLDIKTNRDQASLPAAALINDLQKERAASLVFIGAQRAGTTSLYTYLVRHPAISRAITKELRYFDFNYGRGEPWYRSRFPSAGVKARSTVRAASVPTISSTWRSGASKEVSNAPAKSPHVSQPAKEASTPLGARTARPCSESGRPSKCRKDIASSTVASSKARSARTSGCRCSPSE